MTDLPADRALLSISVTSEMTGVAPQMLRTYEARGLLSPERTPGGTRRYSGNDVARIDEITRLLATGLNLAGVQQVLELREETDRLRAEVARLQAEAADDDQGGRGRRPPT
jgi:DNA-binding transcriptional MerR regulator